MILVVYGNVRNYTSTEARRSLPNLLLKVLGSSVNSDHGSCLDERYAIMCMG